MKAKKIICLATILLGASTAYANNNFTCPAPEEIRSYDFTSPGIWIAPPVVHGEADQVGVGFGGKQVGKLLGIEQDNVGGKDGWVCVYKSTGGTTVRYYEDNIRNIVKGNKFLAKYLDKVNKIFEDGEPPYLKNYPKDEQIGFVAYQLEEHQQQQSKKR